MSQQALAPMPIAGNRRLPLSVRRIVYGSRSMVPPETMDAAAQSPSRADQVFNDALAMIRAKRPSQDADYAQLDTLGQQIGNAPSPEELRADVLRRQLEARLGADQQMDAVPAPQQEMLPQANLPALDLPNAPERQSPQFDPTAGIAAAILGLVSPRNAGQFGAAALKGSLQANEIQHQDVQERFAQDMRRRIALHEDRLTRENIQRRIEQENSDRRYQNTVAETKRRMESAARAAERSELGAEAGAYGAAVPRIQEAKRAGTAAQAIRDRITRQDKQYKETQDNAIDLARIGGQLSSQEEARAQRAELQKERLDAQKRNTEFIREQIRLENEKYGPYRAAASGFSYGPGGPTPLPLNRLPLNVQSTINDRNADNERAANKDNDIATRLMFSQEARAARQTIDNAAKDVRQARDELKSFEIKNPLKKRMQKGEEGRNLRAEWKALNDRIIERQKELDSANAALADIKSIDPNRPTMTNKKTFQSKVRSGVVNGRKWSLEPAR